MKLDALQRPKDFACDTGEALTTYTAPLVAWGRWINLDPMTPYIGAYFAAMPVEDNEAGLLFRHMAVHTTVGNGLSERGMGFELVATETISRELCRGPLWGVNIVAG